MNKLLTGFLGSILILGSSLVSAQFEVSPGNNEGWVDRRSNTGTLGLGIADNNGGASSLLMSTDGTDGQIIKAARLPLPPVLLITIGGITSFSWEFYTDNAGNYPRPQLEYFSNALSGTLVYEASNLSPALGSWQSASVNLGSDLFRDTRTGTLATLNDHKAEVGDVLMNFFEFGYGSTGGTFPATTAYLDNVELNGNTWDFEGVATLPPEPAPVAARVPTLSQWALITLAMLLGGIVFVRRKQLT